MTAYYNEHDPIAAQWLRNLIAERLIAPGDVDERSIEDVRPVELAGYTQCHFFAGIGGWSVALRLAGWPDDRHVWTGSCPCQPFSAAGKGAGFADERHLWPAFFHLISQCQPTTVFGEQVASKDGLNWLDLVRSDLEAEGYAFGAADLCAAGFGAPHIRQRLYWVAHTEGFGQQGRPLRAAGWVPTDGAAQDCELGGLADGGGERRDGIGLCLQPGQPRQDHAEAGRDREACGMGHAYFDGAGRDGGSVPGQVRREDGQHVPRNAGPSSEANRPGPTDGHWRDADWLACRDGRWRPVEPGTFPLAHGVHGRVGLLRGYGNAIVPQVAASFIAAAAKTEY